MKIKPLVKKHRFRRWLRKLFGKPTFYDYCKQNNIELDELHHLPRSDTTIRAIYMCDRKMCEDCSYPNCAHTSDIKHAKNFVDNGYVYEERE